MKKILMIFSSVLCLAGCVKDNGPSEGKKVGEIYVTAKSGARSVLVNLDASWKVRSLADWMSVDVAGRVGAGAFTLYYSSNESDLVRTNATRLGAVVIENTATMVADTLYLRQQGTPDGTEYSSAPQDSYIEFVDAALSRVEVCYVNLSSSNDRSAALAWIESCKSDLVAVTWDAEGIAAYTSNHQNAQVSGSVMIVNNTGKEISKTSCTLNPDAVAVGIDGVFYQVAAFSRSLPYADQIKNLLDAGYDRPDAGGKWLTGGSFYYLSAAEVGYPNTPSWYPQNPSDKVFDADRYARTNNLTDCIWMTHRQFNSTFSEDGKQWRADYVYASNSVWNAAVDVRIGEIPVAGAQHKTVYVTIKY